MFFLSAKIKSIFTSRNSLVGATKLIKQKMHIYLMTKGLISLEKIKYYLLVISLSLLFIF